MFITKKRKLLNNILTEKKAIMVAISVDGIIAGTSASIILITGYVTAIGCFIRSKKQKNRFLLWVGIFLACMGSFYLGTVVSFISLLITGTNLPTNIVGQLCYSWAPIGITVAMYVGLTMINKKFAKPVAIIYALTAILYWWGLWFAPNLNIASDVAKANTAGDVIDIQLIWVVNYVTAVYLVSLGLTMISGFLYLAIKSAGLIRKKAIYQTIGFTLFVICGALDALIEFSALIVFVRIFMVIAYIFLYLGFTKSD